MATVYNAPNSDYNKDQTFAVLNVTEGKKIEFSEAVAKKGDDRILVYAYVTAVESVCDYGNKALTSETWKPQLCKFTILLKPVTVKEKELKPTPGMMVAAHLIDQMGDKPFAGSFDFMKTESDVAWFVLGQGSMTDTTPIPDQMKQMVSAQNQTIQPIEKLDQLEGKELKDPSNGGLRKGGYSSQTQKQKLDDSIEWLIAQTEPGSKLYQLSEKVGHSAEETEAFVKATILDLTSKLLG